MVWDVLPDLMVTEADLSSGSVFAFVVIVIVLTPGPPLVGFTVHHESALVFTAVAVQDAVALNVKLMDPPSVDTTGLVSVPVANSILSTFPSFLLLFSSPTSSLLHDMKRHCRMMINTNRILLLKSSIVQDLMWIYTKL